jgi:hypothetical protein
MSPQNQLNNIISELLVYSATLIDKDNSIIEDYKILNKRCDEILLKIKNRKNNICK